MQTQACDYWGKFLICLLLPLDRSIAAGAVTWHLGSQSARCSLEHRRGTTMSRKSSLWLRCLMVLSIFSLFIGMGWSADEHDQTDISKRIDNSAKVLHEIMAPPDKAIPDKIMNDAKCIAVIPSMIKIAVGFGGNHGKGVATCRTSSGWSAPAPISITGGSWGLQLGGEATDLVMLVMNQKGMDHLLSSKFKIGAEMSGAAGPVGRQAAADTDWKMKAEVLNYSRSRGAFAGIDLNGAAIKQDKDETALLYGKFFPFEAILSGKVPSPAVAQTFLATVRKYARE